MKSLTFSPGLGPDVAVRDGQVHLVWGHAPWVWLVLSRDGELLGRSEQPLAYYPKTNGVISLGHDGSRFISWTRNGGVEYPPGIPQGVHTTGVSAQGLRFFYRAGDGVFTQTGAYCEGVALPNPYASYGWWESRDDGTGKTWDECYYGAKPAGVTGQVYHDPSGRLVVGEGSSGGVQGTLDGVAFTLWPATDTRWPRGSVEGDLVAICCWGDPGPQVRCWIGTVDELQAQGVPQPVLPPVPPQLAGRTLGLGYFFAISDREGPTYGDNLSAPGNCTILHTEAECARSPWPYWAPPGIGSGPKRIGSWVNVPGGQPWPQIGPQDFALYDGGSGLPAVPATSGMTGLECYCDVTESLAACEARMRAWLSRWPTYPVVLIAQAYDKNGTEPNIQKLCDLQGLHLRLAVDFPQIVAILWFSDGRKGGTRDYELWRPVHAEAARVVRNPYAMSQHLDTLQQERAKYGTPLGNANAWAVINATAYQWRAEGWGLLDKPAGNNFQGYSVDVLINTTERQLVDCLQDSEGAGTPTWQVLAWDDSYAARWRPPIPPSGPTPPPSGDLEARVAALEQDMARVLTAMRSV